MEMPDWITSEEDRVKSFKYWPFKKGSCTPAKMAEAGFYSTGNKSEPDSAKCYICFKDLDGWEKDDDPWSEHRKHAPHCAYVKLNKKPSELSIRDVYTLEVERLKNHLSVDYEKKKKILGEMQQTVREELDRVRSKSNKDNRKKTVGKRVNQDV